jgi:hypothetical protein
MAVGRAEKLQKHWEKLPYWQKGAIIGGGLHIGIVLLIVLAALLFVPRTAPPGTGDQGTALAWILFGLYMLLEIIPLFIFRGIVSVFSGSNWKLPGELSNPREVFIWLLYLGYATIFYALLGIVFAIVIKSLKGVRMRRQL